MRIHGEKTTFRKYLLRNTLSTQWSTSGFTQFGGRRPSQAANRLSTAIIPIFVRVNWRVRKTLGFMARESFLETHTLAASRAAPSEPQAPGCARTPSVTRF